MIKMLRNGFTGLAALAVIGALSGLLLGPTFIPQANAAATTQTLHQVLCSPEPSVGQSGPRRVVNTSSTASPQPSYVLNAAGCAVIAQADAGFFISQGYTFGPNQFVTQQMAITANQTAATSTLNLPAYGFIQYIIIEETAGNAVTGGVDCGDSGSAARFVSAFAVAANSTAIATIVAGQGIFSNSGVPAADQILCVAHTGFNSASLNISVIYGYY